MCRVCLRNVLSVYEECVRCVCAMWVMKGCLCMGGVWECIFDVCEWDGECAGRV